MAMASPQEEFIFKSKLPDIEISNYLSLPQYCFEHISEFAERPCLIEASVIENGEGHAYTYAEVELYSRRFAAGFAEMGINKGGVVMLLLPNCAEFVLLFLGLAVRGAAATTCNPFYTPMEIAKQMLDSRAKMVITQSAFLHKLAQVASETFNAHHSFKVMVIDDLDDSNNNGGVYDHHLSELLKADERRYEEVEIDLDDVVALPYSSGTTGLPKGVMLTHRSLITSVAQQVDGDNPNLHIQKEDVMLCVLPMFHIYSLNTVLLCSLRVGASVVIMPKFEIRALLHAMQTYRISVAPLVPPILLAIAKSPISHEYDLSSVRVVMSGAAPLGKDLQAAFCSRLPHAILGQGYGMTEAGPVLAMGLCFAKNALPVKSGACGTVVRNAELKVVDVETGASLPRNHPGEICIRGEQIMKGYVGNKEATSNTIDKNGFLHTGDIGFYDDDDELFIIDRVKEIIKYKGFQVAPAELEGILLAHPLVVDAACVAKKDEVAGEVPVAFVVRSNTGNGFVSEAEIQEFVSKQVVFYKKLHKIYFVDNIPKSPSGKILRKELRLKLEANS